MNQFKFTQLRAFTLEEVLITIGIVGIVAALTLPILNAKIQKDITVEKLKQTYSILHQAIKLSESENGDLGSWIFKTSGDRFYETYLEKYLKISKKNIDISNVKYKQLNGNTMSGWGLYFSKVARISLTNGVNLYFFNSSQRSGDNTAFEFIYADTNGLKKPNQLGKDLFYYTIDAQYGLSAYGIGKSGNKETLYETKPARKILLGDGNSNSCNKTKSGAYCLLLIMVDDWKIKSDYPW